MLLKIPIFISLSYTLQIQDAKLEMIQKMVPIDLFAEL